MSNENQKQQPKFKPTVLEIIIAVALGLSFILAFVDNIVWKLGFMSYFYDIINYAVLVFLAGAFLLAFRKKERFMLLVVTTLILAYHQRVMRGMFLDTGFREFSNMMVILFLFVYIFFIVLTILGFLMKNKFTEHAPRISGYVVGPIFMLYGFIFLLYALIFGFRDYGTRTYAVEVISNVFLYVFFALLLGLPFFELLKGYMKAKPAKEKAAPTEAVTAEKVEVKEEEAKEEPQEKEEPEVVEEEPEAQVDDKESEA